MIVKLMKLVILKTLNMEGVGLNMGKEKISKVYKCTECGHICDSPRCCYRCRANEQIEYADSNDKKEKEVFEKVINSLVLDLSTLYGVCKANHEKFAENLKEKAIKKVRNQ